MPTPREHPYIWATWLAKLLAGQDQCEWAGWFRAHYQDWARQPSDFNNAQWMLDHTALLNRERERLEQRGHLHQRRTEAVELNLDHSPRPAVSRPGED